MSGKKRSRATSLAAIGERLRYGRNYAGLTIAEAAKRADTAPADWRSWERGKTMIPARNCWLVAVRIYGPVEWILTGDWTQHAIPKPWPQLGADLTGFASRVKQARERLGFTLDDVEFAQDETMLFEERWRLWERADDEPDYEDAIRLAEILEVSPEWLYTDTPSTDARSKVANRRSWFVTWLSMPNYGVGFGQRLRQAREAAGYSVRDVTGLLGFHLSIDELETLEKIDRPVFDDSPLVEFDDGFCPAIAMLYGVNLDWLLYGDDALTIQRRRIERLRRRFGLPSPRRKRQTAA